MNKETKTPYRFGATMTLNFHYLRCKNDDR